MVATGGSLYLQALMILGGAIIAAPSSSGLGSAQFWATSQPAS